MLDPVTVRKTWLLTKLEGNRTKHRAIVDRALDGFRDEVLEELERRARVIRSGGKPNGTFSIREPEDHTPDYDLAIQMLSADMEDTVNLGAQQFDQYVRDEWGWKASFTASTSKYQ